MPRVLRIINRFNLGGPTYNVAYLAKYLQPAYETMLVGGMKAESEDSSVFIVKNLGLDPVIIPEMQREIRPLKDIRAYRKLRALIREFKPDIVHTHASKAGTLGRLAAKHEKVPVILHTFHGHVFHSYFGHIKTSFYKTIERRLASISTRIIAISKKQKDELTKIHGIAPVEKVEVVPLGFDLKRFTEDRKEKREQFRKTHNLADDEIAIGIVGRLVPVKNHLLFLKALKYAVDNSNKKVRGFIIGDGELIKDLRLQATRIGLGYNLPGGDFEMKKLSFTSWIRDIDVAYAGLDVVCLTSFNEGTPVSLIEAQAAAKPVLSTRVGGVENIVSDTVSGYLTEVNDEVAFSKKLLYLVENKEVREKMGAAGENQVVQTFHYTRLVDDMKSLYDRLLTKGY